MRGGAKLDIMHPLPGSQPPNNRSVPIKLVGPDSASFTMWLAGDAEHDEINYFEQAGYPTNPGMHVNVLKADHHGSCNGVSARYLDLLHPEWAIASVGAHNEYGHMHEQAKATYAAAGIPWYRTDQNGTVTITAPGTPGSGYTVNVARGTKDMNGPSDRRSRQPDCAGMWAGDVVATGRGSRGSFGGSSSPPSGTTRFALRPCGYTCQLRWHGRGKAPCGPSRPPPCDPRCNTSSRRAAKGVSRAVFLAARADANAMPRRSLRPREPPPPGRARWQLLT